MGLCFSKVTTKRVVVIFRQFWKLVTYGFSISTFYVRSSYFCINSSKELLKKITESGKRSLAFVQINKFAFSIQFYL